MFRKCQSCVLLLIVVSFACFLSHISCRSYNNGLIFYDLETFQPYLPPTVSVSRGRGLASVKFSDKGSIWSTFGKPCECRKNLCGCCAGINVKQYNFNQKMCANVTFVPPKEEALLEIFLNEKPSSKYGISVRNPSPFCIPVMMGIPMAMCVQLSDIAIKGNNLNMCMDFIVRLATTDLFEMHFQCMLMGLDGFQYIDKDGKPVIPPSNSKYDDSAYNDDYYDYEADENEISYGINDAATNNEIVEAIEQQQEQQQHALDSVNAINTMDNTNDDGVNLQQQMQQLQVVQQYEVEKNQMVTQFNSEEAKTTLAPIIVETESEPELIAAITVATAYGTDVPIQLTKTASEQFSELVTKTETIKTTAEIQEIETTTAKPTTTMLPIKPVTNVNDNDATSNSFNNNLPTTSAVNSVSLTTTNGAPISKPIEAPVNYNAVSANNASMTSENVNSGNSTVANIEAVPLESVTSNYASNTSAAMLNVTNFNIDLKATTLADEASTTVSMFIDAPMPATVAISSSNDATAINSTMKEKEYIAPVKIPNNKNSLTSMKTSILTTTITTTTPAVNTVDNIIASTNTKPRVLEIPAASYTTYRHRYV